MNQMKILFLLILFMIGLLNKTYIIACNENYVKSYDYKYNKFYNKYYENNNGNHRCAAIIKYDILKLIELCADGNIRI